MQCGMRGPETGMRAGEPPHRPDEDGVPCPCESTHGGGGRSAGRKKGLPTEERRRSLEMRLGESEVERQSLHDEFGFRRRGPRIPQ